MRRHVRPAAGLLPSRGLVDMGAGILLRLLLLLQSDFSLHGWAWDARDGSGLATRDVGVVVGVEGEVSLRGVGIFLGHLFLSLAAGLGSAVLGHGRVGGHPDYFMDTH